MIRPVSINDAKDICEIYNYYIENTIISFEEKKVSIETMQDRIDQISAEFPWLVFEKNNKVLGFAYASRWKNRSAYRFTLESTAYLASDMAKKGIGAKLYQNLFKELDTSIAHSVMAVIALPNQASVHFHEKMGFEKVAHFKEVGYKLEQWIDVGYWQKIL